MSVSFENIHLPATTHFGCRHYQLRADQQFKIEPHFHLMYELMWFREIAGGVTIGDQHVELTDNTLLFVPSLMVHELTTGPVRHDFFLLQYGAALYADLNLSPQQQPTATPLIQQLNQEDGSHLDHLLAWLVRLEQGAGQAVLKQSVMRTLVLLVRHIQQNVQVSSEQALPPQQQRSRSKILPLVQRLEVEPKLQMNLDDAAASCGMSRYHFSRTFKALLGQNFKDYLLKRKLSMAIGLLVNSQLTIAEIAYQCDFTDSAYFCAKFKQHMGQTPRQFRQATIAGQEF